MSQRSVEAVIGRLATDEDLRRRFREAPERVLRELAADGLELTTTEVASLVACGRRCVDAIAGVIDPRLEKASLKTRNEGARVESPQRPTWRDDR
jgi:hypothetical protein